MNIIFKFEDLLLYYDLFTKLTTIKSTFKNIIKFKMILLKMTKHNNLVIENKIVEIMQIYFALNYNVWFRNFQYNRQRCTR